MTRLLWLFIIFWKSTTIYLYLLRLCYVYTKPSNGFEWCNQVCKSHERSHLARKRGVEQRLHCYNYCEAWYQQQCKRFETNRARGSSKSWHKEFFCQERFPSRPKSADFFKYSVSKKCLDLTWMWNHHYYYYLVPVFIWFKAGESFFLVGSEVTIGRRENNGSELVTCNV